MACARCSAVLPASAAGVGAGSRLGSLGAGAGLLALAVSGGAAVAGAAEAGEPGGLLAAPAGVGVATAVPLPGGCAAGAATAGPLPGAGAGAAAPLPATAGAVGAGAWAAGAEAGGEAADGAVAGGAGAAVLGSVAEGGVGAGAGAAVPALPPLPPFFAGALPLAAFFLAAPTSGLGSTVGEAKAKKSKKVSCRRECIQTPPVSVSQNAGVLVAVFRRERQPTRRPKPMARASAYGPPAAPHRRADTQSPR